MIFSSYLVVRVFYQTYIALYYCYPGFVRVYTQTDELIVSEGKHPNLLRSLLIFTLITNVLSQLINLHWFRLICKQLSRNLKKAFAGTKDNEPDAFMTTNKNKKD